MKKNLTLLFLACALFAKAQNSVVIKVDPGNGTGPVTQVIQDNGSIPVASSLAQLNTFDLTATTIATGHKLTVNCAGVSLAAGVTPDYITANSTKTYTFQGDIVNAQITINDEPVAGGGTSKFLIFKFIKSTAAIPPVVPPVLPTVILPPISSILNNILPSYDVTPTGYILKGDRNKVVHIFFDQYGNNLIGAIPQGISNRQYVVHIIYPGYASKAMDVTYSVKQKSGSFSSAILYNNSNIIAQLGNKLQGNQVKNYDTWLMSDFPLGIATDDLTFDIVATTVDDTGKPVKGTLDTYTIKMAPVYHGTFDVGLINSHLNNPTYSLVAAPNGSTDKVVKQEDAGHRGIVTIMLTPYTSVPLLIKKLLSKDKTGINPSGRNYLDDQSFFERIYPTVGVSLSSKTFENLFFGLNWEIARGVSVFGGGHWGKVNIFNPNIPGYLEGTTAVTQAQFDYYKNTKWDIAWAYGVKLDVTLVTSLFK